jgi:Putative phage abortive infection protein
MPTEAKDESPDVEITEATKHVARLRSLAYTGVAFAIAVIAVYVWQFNGPLSKEPDKWGQFGDYVGGLLNPTFSLLALLALLATLGLQIRELQLSVKELRNSATALTKQNETLRLQAFEGTFFQLLRLHNDIVSSMELPNLSLKGRACFQYYLSDLEGQLINRSAIETHEAFLQYYDLFYTEHQAALGHYFRLLYNIIKLVDRTDNIDRHFYTNIVRAQLSSAELKMLFYNCLSSFGREKFKPLIERYALLKTIPDTSVPANDLLQRYSPAAFGGRYPASKL